MNYKPWLISGVIIFIVSIACGTLGMLWWMWDVTQNQTHQTRINSDGSFDTPGVMYAALFMLVGCLIGGVLIFVGGLKAYSREKQKAEPQ